MKRILSVALLLALFVCGTAQVSLFAAASGNQLFIQMKSAMASRSYPAVVRLAETFLKEYPNSPDRQRVCLMQGESFARLERYAPAVEALSPYVPVDATAAYWCGRALLALEKPHAAANALYQSVRLFEDRRFMGELSEDDEACLVHALVYSAVAMDAVSAPEQAVLLLERALASRFVAEDLEAAVPLLFALYEKSGAFEKTLALYGSTETLVRNWPVAVSEPIQLSVLKAYEGLGTGEGEQWTLCIELMGSTSEAVALSALQSAYTIAENSSKYETSLALETAEPFLQQHPEWRSALWRRLGVGAFDGGDYDKARAYFNQADESADTDGKAVSALYRARMLALEGKPALGAGVLKPFLLENTTEGLRLCVALVQYELQAGNTANAESYKAELVRRADSDLSHPLAPQALYYAAYLSALNGGWADAREMLERFLDADSGLVAVSGKAFPEAALLYAAAIEKTALPGDSGTLARAEGLFEAAFKACENSPSQRVAAQNLAVHYLLAGDYRNAYSVAAGHEALHYEAGLGALGAGDWETAAGLLGIDTPYGLYYTAYAQFQRGYTREAARLFTRFAKENRHHRLTRSAWLYASLAAVQNKDTGAAIDAAKEALACSNTDEEKIEAVRMCVELYVQQRDYNKALALLEPYSRIHTPNVVSLRFTLSDVYAAKGDMAGAVDVLLATYNEYYQEYIKEEALYRLAELYFRQGRFTEAASRFETCRRTFPDGMYTTAALYYNALSAEKADNPDQAVLLYTLLTQSANNSTYLFSAWTRLAFLNYDLGDYAGSLAAVENAVRISPEEAGAAGLSDLKAELRRLEAGEAKETAALRTQYENAGMEATEKGRSAGVKLAKAYLQSAAMRDEGAAILLEITGAVAENSTRAADRRSAGEAWTLLGRYYGQELRLDDSAAAYLTGAAFYNGLETQLQLEALYRALETLHAEGRRADCDAVLASMESLDSESVWVERAGLLLR